MTIAAPAKPLLTVIIPTSDRAAMLRRAIQSALGSGGTESLEVVVVPNGSSTTWQVVADAFARDGRVRFVPIAEAHASKARNAGLRSASGHFIRFLDDDDVLYPMEASRQLSLMAAGAIDVCSGEIDVMDAEGNPLPPQRQPGTTDLVAAMLGPGRRTFTHAHLYRAAAIDGHRWNESLDVGQDVEWMLRLCSTRTLAWAKVDFPVGAWLHHRGPRIYRGRHPGGHVVKRTASMILDAVAALEDNAQLTPQRRIAAADGLWGCFQKGLMHDVRGWLHIAKVADSLAPGRTPPSRVYRLPLLGRVDPRAVELCLVPFRIAHAAFQSVMLRLRNANR